MKLKKPVKVVTYTVSMEPVEFGSGGNGKFRAEVFADSLRMLIAKHLKNVSDQPAKVSVDEWQ